MNGTVIQILALCQVSIYHLSNCSFPVCTYRGKLVRVLVTVLLTVRVMQTVALLLVHITRKLAWEPHKNGFMPSSIQSIHKFLCLRSFAASVDSFK